MSYALLITHDQSIRRRSTRYKEQSCNAQNSAQLFRMYNNMHILMYSIL